MPGEFALAKHGQQAHNLRVNSSFEALVEAVRGRSVEEKEELRFLLERALIEQRRHEIRTNHRRSKDEVKRGSLKFSSSIGDLKEALAA